jgi:3-phenylpropionate/trans-cinnamate dioxygenase ferredoxin component
MADQLLHMQLPQLTDRKWVRACTTGDLSEDEGLQLAALPPVAVFTSDGDYFCIDDTCTHETFSLAEGWVEGCVVECSLHLAKFCLRTGDALSPPASAPVAVHPVYVIGDEIFVALPTSYLLKEGL